MALIGEAMADEITKLRAEIMRLLDLLKMHGVEIERLQAAKRAALAIADERSKENVALRAENKALKKQVEKLRNALAPFACLSVKELRPGDTNRARRALQ